MSYDNQFILTIGQVKSTGSNEARAGTQALTLLSQPINAHVLEALAQGPQSLADLRQRVGVTSQTTLRSYLRTLTETGVLARMRRNDFPGSIDFNLTAAGRDLLGVAAALRAWLSKSPGGSLPMGSDAARSAIKALVEGWNSRIIRAVAAKPLSLTELDSVIAGLSYPSLERRLAAMRLASQVEAAPSRGRGRGRPHAATDWLRWSIAPLTAAARWERRYVPAHTAALNRLDVEAAFLLVVPALSLSADLSGACRLVVEAPGAEGLSVAGVLLRVVGGRIVSCTSRIEGVADAWASGSASAWFRAVIDGHTDMLELGGSCVVASSSLDCLHRTLFGSDLGVGPSPLKTSSVPL